MSKGPGLHCPWVREGCLFFKTWKPPSSIFWYMSTKFPKHLNYYQVNAKAERHFTARKSYMQMNVGQGVSPPVCTRSALRVEGKLADPAFPWGPIYPTGWSFSQLLGGDNVFHIWNSYHLCLASFAILRVVRGTILKLICWVFGLSVRNRRKQAWSQYLSDTCRPSARARSRRICC